MFSPGTLVRLIQPELFNEDDLYVVIGPMREDSGGSVCKILKSRTGEIFGWYTDILVEVK